jgi:hypothetical protein
MSLTSNSVYYAFPDPPENFQADANFVWDTGSLSWVKMTQSGGGGGGAVTIADGADVNSGSTTDAALTTDAAGTLSAKLRGLVKWAFERMPASLGQKPMATSLPVVIASDQSSIPVTANAGTNLNTSALLLDATFTGRINTLGQKTMAASTPVVIASDQAAIPVTSGLTELVPSAPAVVNVTTTSGFAVAANANRRGLILTNSSNSVLNRNATISISFGAAAAVAGSGIVLAPGQSFVMDANSFYTGIVRAIADYGTEGFGNAAADAKLAVQEFTS